MKDDTLICRCEELTVGDIKRAVRQGATTVDGVKRVTRAGKGLCQGRTCRALVEQIIIQETGRSPEDMEYPNSRPPVRPVRMSILKGDD